MAWIEQALGETIGAQNMYWYVRHLMMPTQLSIHLSMSPFAGRGSTTFSPLPSTPCLPASTSSRRSAWMSATRCGFSLGHAISSSLHKAVCRSYGRFHHPDAPDAIQWTGENEHGPHHYLRHPVPLFHGFPFSIRRPAHLDGGVLNDSILIITKLIISIRQAVTSTAPPALATAPSHTTMTTQRPTRAMACAGCRSVSALFCHLLFGCGVASSILARWPATSRIPSACFRWCS